MADSHNRDHLSWLRQVAHDDELTAFACRVAIGLTQYFNRGTGEAFMSQKTLALGLSASIDGIRKAVAQLHDRGHLAVTHGLGRTVVSRYRPILKTPTARPLKGPEKPDSQTGFQGAKTPTAVRENPDSQRQKTQTARPIEPPEDKPPEEPPESFTAVLPLELTPTITSKPATDQQAYGADFGEFWGAYPLRVGRKAAMAAYVKARKAGNSAEMLLTAASAYAGERAGRDPTYTKHPATWLNGERWADEQAPGWSPPAERSRARTAVDWALEGADE